MRLNATNVRRIACGQWGKVYDEMTGAALPEDLDRVFAVQMGKAVEPFLVGWLCDKHTLLAWGPERIAEHLFARVRRSPLNPTRWWLERDGYSARPDALVVAPDKGVAVLEVKLTNERTTAEAAIARYMPQVALTMHVCGLERAVLGVAYGNTRMTCYFTRQDKDYLQALLAEANDFRFHLELGTRPGDPAVPFIERVAPPPTTTRPWKEDEPCPPRLGTRARPT